MNQELKNNFDDAINKMTSAVDADESTFLIRSIRDYVSFLEKEIEDLWKLAGTNGKAAFTHRNHVEQFKEEIKKIREEYEPLAFKKFQLLNDAQYEKAECTPCFLKHKPRGMAPDLIDQTWTARITGGIMSLLVHGMVSEQEAAQLFERAKAWNSFHTNKESGV